tara:strand:+ start:10274 stop:19447 length:9174 start_codon:yes stop_codon:yes gene_type:complete
MSEFIPPPGAIISDVEEEKNQQGGFILPEGAIATDVDKEPSMEADALGAIEDEIIDKTAEVQDEEEEEVMPAEVARYIQKQLRDNKILYTWKGEKTADEMHNNGNYSYLDSEDKAEELDRAKKEHSLITQKAETKAATNRAVQEEKDKKDLNRDDFELEETDFVKVMNQKYLDRGITFEEANVGNGVSVLKTDPETGDVIRKDFDLGGFDFHIGDFGKQDKEADFDNLKNYVDNISGKPAEELTEVDRLMRGRHPEMNSSASLEEQQEEYMSTVEKIENSEKLTPEQKWAKISNLSKPRYSDIEFNRETEKYEFKPTNDFQSKINDSFKDIIGGAGFAGSSNYESEGQLIEDIKKRREEVISNDPILNRQAKNIQLKLEPQFKKMAEEISSKYDMSNAEDVEAAKKEFDQAKRELFNKNLSENKVYRHVVTDIDSAIDVAANKANIKYKRTNTGSTFDDLVFATGDIVRLISGGETIASGVEALTTGFKAQTGKAWNATQIAMQQFDVETAQSNIDETALLNDKQKIVVNADGSINQDKSKEQFGTEGFQATLTQASATPRSGRYNLDGTIDTKKRDVYGGEMKTKEMTVGEYRKYQEDRKEKFKKDIDQDIKELDAYEKTLELVPSAKFDDGVNFKDIMLTVANVIPQVGIGVGGALLAPATGGGSIVASTMFMGMQEFGNNYWDAVETGLTEELGRPPTKEEIAQALSEDKYSDQGTAAGWAAVSSILETGTGLRGAAGLLSKGAKIQKGLKGTKRIVEQISKKSGYKGAKDLFVKQGRNMVTDMFRDGAVTFKNAAKSGFKEYLTEATQELSSQASVAQALGDNAMDRLDFKAANEAGIGGGIFGFILPSAGAMRRGGVKAVRLATKQASIGLNWKGAESYKQADKFYQQAVQATDKMLKDGVLTKEEHQQELSSIADSRNAAMKIPNDFSATGRQEALELMLEKKRLETNIKNNDDVFVDFQKNNLEEINTRLKVINNVERAHNSAVKATKGADMKVDVVRSKNTESVALELDRVNPSGKGEKNSAAAQNKFGINVSKNPKTGRSTIILNEDLIGKQNQWTTAQHEVLHSVLESTLKLNPRNAFALEASLFEKLNTLDEKQFKDSNLRKRLKQYKKNREIGGEIKAEETLTLFSEALATGDIKFDKGLLEKLGDLVRRVFQQVAPGSSLGKIKFETAEDVYKFMKDYNRSMKKGKFSRAQKAMIKDGAAVSDELQGEVKDLRKKSTKKTLLKDSAVIDESEFDSIQDETGQEVDEELQSSRIDEMDEIIRDIPEEIAEEESKELDETATEEEVIKQFRPLAAFIAANYKGNAKYPQMREDLIKALLTDGRGILGLFRDYKKKVASGEFDGTAGQFINNQKAGIRIRAIQIAAEVLGYADAKTGPYKSPVPEGRQEGESLRRTMGFFTTKELDQMLADREINKAEYDKLLKSSQQQVIKNGPNKGKSYGEVIDGFFNKVKAQVQKGVLITPKQIVNYLTNEFKTKRFVADIKDLMGTPNSQQYKDFLNNFSEAIYDKLTQRQINKRFAFAKEAVIDPETGKQKRMTVGESQAVGAQVSDKKAGNPIFKKKAFNKDEFIEEQLNPTTGRPASKQTALAESVAEVVGFDASQQALQDPETLANLTDRNRTMADLEVVSNDIANQTARGMTFKFSLDDGSTGSISQEDAPNLQKDLDTFNKLVLDKGFEDGDGNLVPEVAEALEKASPKLRELINYLYKENPELNVDAKGFKNEVLEAIKTIDPALYDKIKNKETVLRSIVKGVKNYNKAVTDRMNAGSQALGKIIDSRVFGALGFDFLGYKNGILDPAGKKIDKKATKESKANGGPRVYQTNEDGSFVQGMYFNEVQALKELQFTDELFEKYVKDLDKLGIKLSDAVLMNKDSKKLQDIIKPIFEATNLERKLQLLEESRVEIEKANTANKLLFKYIANKLNEAYKKRDVDLEYVFQMLQTQTNISLGFRSLSGFDFMYLKEGDQYVEGKTKTPISKWLTMTEAQRAEVLEDFNTVNDFKERYNIHLKNNLESGKMDLANAQWQAAFGTISAYKDLTIKGEHLGANANTMAKIFLGIAEGNLTDASLEEMFVEHTQLFGPTYLMDVIDAKGVEGGKKTGATSKEGIFRLTKFLKNNPKFSRNLYAKTGNKAFIELGNVDKLAKEIKTLNKNQKAAKDENIVVLKDSKVLDVEDNMSMEEVLSKAKTVDEALKQANKLNSPVKKIRVFDFDDTLATTESNVIANLEGESITLTAEEFAEQGKSLQDQGYKFDFSEFNKVTKGAEGPLLKIAKKIKDARGNEDLFVLTARAPQAQQAIYEFLKSQGVKFKKENIIGLGKSTGAAKANWIVDQAAKGYNDFYFADDAIQNVQAVRDALSVIDVKSEVQQAKMKFSEDINEDFNNIIEQKSGVASGKRYSEAKGKVRGSSKGKFKFWIPPSAEDFMGLIYPLLSKGKLGESQMAWFKEHLLDPFAKAAEALSQARLNLMNDFKALKKDLDVPKELTKEAVDGFTNEQAVRVYLWNKQGIEIPGLSKTDAKELSAIIENNPKLKLFADKLIQINKRPYPAPADSWLAGTITSDLIQGLKVKRSELLSQWQANADLIFSKENLNKLESIHGPKYREALENILSRMKAGSNRLQTGNRLSNRILNYINGSNAAIMFFNTRSAVLQTISAANFINWSFNSPLKAGKAFANQPQYWKDFMNLMNSDFLKDRRNGLRINISESEIADLAKTSKNKAKAVMAYILQKGYAPTQFADSFAIALGGATFYRNKIIDLMKNENMTKAEAEKQAMREFREISETSQQSARPDKISQQQSSDVGRLILMFANTPMQYSRLMKRAFQDLAAGRGSSKANISKIAYYGFVQNMLFNALQQALFKVGFGDDDEEDKNKRVYRTVNGMADSLLRGLGIGGAAVSVAKNFLLDIYERSGRSRPEYSDSVWKLLQFSPPIGSKISRIRAAGWAFDSAKRRQEILDKGFSLDNPGFMAGAKVISSTTNIPLDRVLLKMENLEGAMNEEADWWQRVAMIGGWPAWDIMKDGTDRNPPKSKYKNRYKKSTGKYKKKTYKKR